jgi:hypothetical protein
MDISIHSVVIGCVPEVSFNSGTTGATSGTGIAYPSGGPELIPCFGSVRVAQSVVFCHSVVCPSIYGFCVPLWYLCKCLLTVGLYLVTLLVSFLSDKISYIAKRFGLKNIYLFKKHEQTSHSKFQSKNRRNKRKNQHHFNTPLTLIQTLQ